MQINLLPQPSPLQQIRSIVLMSVAGAMVLVNLWIGVSLLGANREKNIQAQILQDADRQIETLQVTLKKQKKLETEAGLYQVLAEWSASRPNFRSEIHLLSSLLPENSFLRQMEFLEERTFAIQAVFPNMESVSTYLRFLEEEPEIEEILVENVTRREFSEADSGTTSFIDPTSLPEKGEVAFSLSGLWQSLWQEPLRLLFSPGVAHASDDGREIPEEEEDQDMGEWNDSSNSGQDSVGQESDGQGSEEQGNGGQERDSQSSDLQESKSVIRYELNLRVTMKRDQ